MNTEPPTGDDMQKMLVSMKQNILRSAAETPQSNREREPWFKRHLGITFVLVVVLGLGSTTAALAAILPATFQFTASAPISTPTMSSAPTPSATPSAGPTITPDPTRVNSVIPQPAANLDCSALGDDIGVAGIIPDAKATSGVSPYFANFDAAFIQAGALDCSWTENGSHSDHENGVHVRIAPAADRGRPWIKRLNASGEPSLGLGNASAISCTPSSEAAGCDTSVVIGPWWFEASFPVEPVADSAGGLTATMTAKQKAVLAALVDRLSTVTPQPVWVAPATSWSSMTGCDDLSSARIAVAVGTPKLVGPTDAYARFTYPGLFTVPVKVFDCSWDMPMTATPPPPQGPDPEGQNIRVSIAPAGGWVFGTVVRPGSPVKVVGASQAGWSCSSLISIYYTECYVDLVSDNTWLRVSSEYSDTPANKQRMIMAAEAILAAHDAR